MDGGDKWEIGEGLISGRRRRINKKEYGKNKE
jgi:hypothetical protein